MYAKAPRCPDVGAVAGVGYRVAVTREEKLLGRLRTGLDAEHVALEDESARHVGHEGARGGAGHYNVLVVAARFAGLDAIARHRAVYAAVGDMIPDEVHALSIRSLTPEEWRRDSRS
jgi:BolA family transcriptional regulator, general stress-responsive regulator